MSTWSLVSSLSSTIATCVKMDTITVMQNSSEYILLHFNVVRLSSSMWRYSLFYRIVIRVFSRRFTVVTLDFAMKSADWWTQILT